MKPQLLVLFCVVIFLSGCATSSPIRRYSESKSAFMNGPVLMSHKVPDSDIYRIYHRGATGFVSIQTLREEAEARAQDFCQRQGKSMLVLGEKISPPPYILGNFPRIEIVFGSVEKPKSAIGRPTGDPYARLRELKKLMDDGTLEEEEFEREKRKILNGQ